MAKIRILPEQLANQIAAGEVVERPASVVKELLENSLDAGATRIDIEIEGGGTGLIRIIDNGEGMDEDDVLLSLERHGTSKIATDEDLAAIITLGFRGEAIPSIASVSKMVITSRRRGAELGTRAEVHFGKLIRVHEAGCMVGTMLEVRNLFGNTPARRKFLRTVRTELGHIEEVVRNYALARPDTGFTLSVNGHRNLAVDHTLGLRERLAAIINYQGRLLEIGLLDERAGSRRVSGLLIPPEQLGVGPARLRLFVNGRAVKDRMIGHAVAEGLRGFLMKGKNPAGLIRLDLPADEVDVNVHPAKHEVRFRNSRELHQLISSTVAAAMREEQQLLQTAIFGKDRSQQTTVVPLERDEPAGSPFMADEPPVPGPLPPRNPTAPSRPATVQAPEGEYAATIVPLPGRPAGGRTVSHAIHHTIPGTTVFNSAEPGPAPIGPVMPAKISTAPVRQSSLLADQPQGHRLEIIGQFAELYIFCRNQHNQLVVIDQHAAHERLVFEELRRQYLGRAVARQNLLFPVTVDLSLFQARLVEGHLDELESMGFSLREFGGNSFLITAVPAIATRVGPAELLADVLEQFGSESGRRNQDEIIDSILSTMACKAAVKAGTTLSLPEIEALLERMARADLFSHCPHGRPVVKIFSQQELQKWFHRT